MAGEQGIGGQGGEVFDGAPVGGGVVIERAVRTLGSADAGHVVTADEGVTGDECLTCRDQVGAMSVGMSVRGYRFRTSGQVERSGLPKARPSRPLRLSTPSGSTRLIQRSTSGMLRSGMRARVNALACCR